jgi:xanthine/CO dehydrogenase XdhC/CoxF family maturation factor
MAQRHEHDPACAVAHGEAPAGLVAQVPDRTLVAVFGSPVSEHLLRFGAELGFRGILVEPIAERAIGVGPNGTDVFAVPPADLDGSADVVVTDHHRPELGPILRDVLKCPVRWVGLMGNARHIGPHVQALTELGVAAEEIARVHRPVGLNIGSRTPPEIALATLAGLVADRNGRPGGFVF